MTDMETQMIRALAEIDRELGMPDDGCNSTEKTITAQPKHSRMQLQAKPSPSGR